MTLGTLYGLGLGPGDSELVTLKALRLLRAAPVVAYSAPEGGASFARQIVAEWLDPPHPTLSSSGGEGRVRGTRQREIAIRFPMRPGPPPAEIYRSAAARLAAVLDGGEDVAYLCQGDPLFYGSFVGLLERLLAGGHYPITIVPGVSSPSACAAAAALPLAHHDEVLSVIPATLPEVELVRRLGTIEAAAIVKLGRHFAKLRRVLAQLGLLDAAVYVERASLPNQRVMPLAAVDPASVPYFATALVRRRRGSPP
jgi:precorrin-2/cobalt-factor-2 C20-methyltransferase